MRPEYELVMFSLAALVGLLAVLQPAVALISRVKVNLTALALLFALAVPLINAIKASYDLDIL